MIRVKDSRHAASYAASCGRMAYVSPDGDALVVAHVRPAVPPYVAVAPGDGMEVALARIKRLAAAPRRRPERQI